MRKYIIGATLVAALSIVAVAYGNGGTGDNISTLDANFTPNHTTNNTFKSGAIAVHVTTLDATDPGTSTNPTIQGDPTKNVKLSFDHAFKFTTSQASLCTANLNGTTTAQAKSMCGPTKQVGSGTAHVCINNGSNGCLPQGSVGTGVVTAFNGPTNNHIILHTRFDNLNNTTIITGALKTITTGSGDYLHGAVLNVPVPDIAAGAGTLTDFEVTVQHAGYVKAKCQNSDTAWNTKATFKYSTATATPNDNPNDAQACTVDP